eukprot:2144224-Prymnesium_polylepis.1
MRPARRGRRAAGVLLRRPVLVAACAWWPCTAHGARWPSRSRPWHGFFVAVWGVGRTRGSAVGAQSGARGTPTRRQKTAASA